MGGRKTSPRQRFGGGHQNLVTWVGNSLEGSELPGDLVLREDGGYRGGASAVVSCGVSCRGEGAF